MTRSKAVLGRGRESLRHSFDSDDTMTGGSQKADEDLQSGLVIFDYEQPQKFLSRQRFVVRQFNRHDDVREQFCRNPPRLEAAKSRPGV